MNKAYGFIEITGVVAAMDALDIMCKTADVELASWERKLGVRGFRERDKNYITCKVGIGANAAFLLGLTAIFIRGLF